METQTKHYVKESREVAILHEERKIKAGDIIAFKCGALELVINVEEKNVFHIGQGKSRGMDYIDKGIYNKSSGGIHLSRYNPNYFEVGSTIFNNPEENKFGEYKQMLQEAGIWRE